MDSAYGNGTGDAQDWVRQQAAEWDELQALFAIGHQIRRTADPSMRLAKESVHLIPDQHVRQVLAEHAAHAYRHGLPPEGLMWRGVQVSFEHRQAAQSGRATSELAANAQGFHAVLTAEHREYRVPLPSPQPDHPNTFAEQVFTVVSGALDEAALTVAQSENIREMQDRAAQAGEPEADGRRGRALDATSRGATDWAQLPWEEWEELAKLSDRNKRRFIEQVTGKPWTMPDLAGPMTEPLSEDEHDSFAIASYAAKMAALGFPLTPTQRLNSQRQPDPDPAPPQNPPGRSGQEPER